MQRAFGFTVLALCLTSCVGGVAAFVYLGFFADASLYVFHGGGTARVFLDGHPVATFAAPAGSSPARDVRLLRVPRGPHQLAIEHDVGAVQTWTIDASGLDDLLVPTDPSTCFASIEVSRALYGVEGTPTRVAVSRPLRARRQPHRNEACRASRIEYPRGRRVRLRQPAHALLREADSASFRGAI